MYEYRLYGVPVPLARPRMGTRTVYDSQKNMKLIHGIELSKQHENRPMFSGHLHLDAVFVFPMPKKTPAKQREVLNNSFYKPRPDIDNLIKYIADIATGILYQDDCNIVSVTAKKVYGEEAHTVFKIKNI